MGRHGNVEELAAAGSGTRADVPPSRRAGVVAVLVGAGVLAVAGWLSALFPGDNLRYDAGWAGRPGTFTAAHCEEHGSGKGGHRFCRGVFSSADGGVTGRQVTLEDARVDVGRPVVLRLRSDGGYAVPGWDNVLFDLGGCCALLAGAGAVAAFAGMAPQGVVIRKDVPLAANGRPWAPLIRAGGALATVCGGLALALYPVGFVVMLVREFA